VIFEEQPQFQPKASGSTRLLSTSGGEPDSQALANKCRRNCLPPTPTIGRREVFRLPITGGSFQVVVFDRSFDRRRLRSEDPLLRFAFRPPKGLSKQQLFPRRPFVEPRFLCSGTEAPLPVFRSTSVRNWLHEEAVFCCLGWRLHHRLSPVANRSDRVGHLRGLCFSFTPWDKFSIARSRPIPIDNQGKKCVHILWKTGLRSGYFPGVNGL